MWRGQDVRVSVGVGVIASEDCERKAQSLRSRERGPSTERQRKRGRKMQIEAEEGAQIRGYASRRVRF